MALEYVSTMWIEMFVSQYIGKLHINNINQIIRLTIRYSKIALIMRKKNTITRTHYNGRWIQILSVTSALNFECSLSRLPKWLPEVQTSGHNNKVAEACSNSFYPPQMSFSSFSSLGWMFHNPESFIFDLLQTQPNFKNQKEKIGIREENKGRAWP